jgi:hypothetical protein
VDIKKFLTWLGVAVVLFVCLIGSCLLAAFSLSEAGRGITGGAWREAGRIGREEEKEPGVNESYNLSFDENGSVHFYGDGLELTLPPGYKVKTPKGRSKEAPPFSYFLASGDGRTQVRLRREDEVPGGGFWYGGDRELLFAHARAYAEAVAGKAAVEAAPLAYVAPTRLEVNAADVGIEGCYRYTGAERARQGFDGEYFVFWGRGYGNAVLVSVAFGPFAREEGLARGRALADALRFN